MTDTTSNAVPLNDAQLALWAFYKLAPRSPAYNMAYAAQLHEHTDLERLKPAFAQVLAAHEALHCAYREEDGVAVMVEPTALQPDFGVEHAEDWSEAQVHAWLAAQADLPFVLEQGRVCRFRLLMHRGAGGRQLYLSAAVHHIAGDFLSFEMLCEQVFGVYERLSRGEDAALPAPGLYRQWLQEQRMALDGEAGRNWAQFWERQLDGEPEPLALSTDFPRPREPRYDGEEIEWQMSPRQTAALKALAAQAQVSLFSLLVALFQVLMHRFSGHDDFLVGTPMSGRGGRSRSLMGYTLNAVPLRARLHAGLSVLDVARSAQRQLRAALKHQQYPLARMTTRFARADDGGAAVLFRHMLTMVPHGRREALYRHVLREFHATQRGAVNDLNLRWQDEGPTLLAQWRFNSSVFRRERIEGFAHGMGALIAQVLGAPDSRLSTLRVAPDDRLSRSRGAERPCEGTALQAFERCVRERGMSPALVGADGVLSFGALDRAATAFAGRLHRRGVRPGAVVALWLPRGIPLVVGMLASWKLGAAYLCLDTSWPAHRSDGLLRDSAAAVVVGQGAAPGGLASSDWLDIDAAQEGVACPPLPERLQRTDLPAYLIYTSGSTGTPKGVLVAQGALRHYADAVLEVLALPQEASLAALSSVAADLGHTAWFGALLSGRPLRLIDDALASDPEALAQSLERAPVDCLKIVPSHLKALLAVDRPQRLLPRLCLVTGGEALDLALVQRLRALRPDLRIVNHYGPTETTVGCVAHELDATAAGTAPIGRPMARMRVQVLDGRLDALPIGNAGELAIGGAGVALGYLRRPSLTAERFVPDAFGEPGARMYRSGDRVCMRDDGALTFLGRADHQVKIRGYRVELGEIEAWLKLQPELRDAAVLARAGADGGLRLVAYLAADVSIGLQALRARMAAALPDPMLPSAFVQLDRLPLTRNGKLDRQALPDPQDAPSRPSQPPATEAERTLAAIWEQVLQREPIGVEDRFFDLGGDSILALQVIARARAKGLRLSPKQVFELQTVRALAAAAVVKPAPAADAISPAPRSDSMPLSFGQERLWFLHQLDPQAAHYNVPGLLRLSGELDAQLVHGAFQALVQRHEALRTCFVVGGSGQPGQRVEPAVDVPLPVVDLSALDAPVREREVQRLSQQDAARPFDLARAPLLRLALLKLQPREHVLLLTLHHIVCDGWSMSLLARELAELLDAGRTGRAPDLAPLPIQVADHAAWQRRVLSSEVLGRQLAHWSKALGTDDPVLALPTDHPRPAAPSHRGDCHAFVIDAELSAALRRLADAHGASLAMLMLAAFQLLLARLSGQHDIRVGMPVAGRQPVETERLIGFFVNTVVVRAEIRPMQPFTRLLQQVKDAALAAQSHQDLPFERLVEALAPQRRMSHTPLFQVLFNLQHTDFSALRRVAGLDVAIEARDNGTAQFDLILDIDDTGDTMQASLRYRSELWDAATPRRWAGHYLHLLRAVVRDAGQPAALLPLVDDAPKAEPVRRFEVASSLPAVFEAQVDANPERIALSLDAADLTYAELDRRANHLAQQLIERGAGPQAAVGLCVRRSFELVVGVLAILKAGAAYLPLEPDAPRERLRDMLADSGARLLVSEEPWAAGLPGLTVLGFGGPHSEPAPRPRGRVTPDHLAYVIYTSGSTGRPKGVPVTHRNVLRLFASTDAFFRFGADDVWTLFHSVAFDFSVWELFGALLHGGRLVIVPYWASRSPQDFHALLCREAVTVLNQTPSAFRQLSQVVQEQGDEAPPHRLRFVIFGGEALDTGSLKGWYARHAEARPRLVNMYGITETTVHVTLRPLHAADAAQPGRSPIGEPIADLQLHLLDAQLNPVPVGVPGELHVGGDGLACGYLGRASLTATRFVPDPFSGVPGARLYRSGDLACRRADGSLEYLGRIDHQVKLRGFRIELGEIEARLSEHTSVREAVVLVREDRPGDPQLVAYVVAHGGATPAPAALRAHLAQRLPDYMLPSAFVTLAAMPLTRNGKLDRAALPAPQGASADDGAPPETPEEQWLAGVWSELLGVERIGRHANFFELGGHSLLATRVVSRLRSERGLDVSVRALFESPTIAQLAQRLPKPGSVSPGGPVPVPRVPQMPLSHAQQRLWLADRLAGGSAAYNLAAALRLSGPLDLAALHETLLRLVERHEVLRTSYPEVDGEPVACIADRAVLELPCTDLSPLDPASRAARVRDAQVDDAARPFDLAQAPLLRTRLLKLGAQEHVLLIALHHLVADGWSVGVLVDEFAAGYRALRDGCEPAWPPLPLQVVDHAVWQRDRMQGEHLRQLLDRGVRTLRGAPSLLALRTDFPRPAVASHDGDVVRVPVPAALIERLEQLARRHDATLFMVLLAGFQALLHGLSGQDDVVIGTDVAGRTHRELEGLIGFFVNVVPLRSRAGANDDFAALLRQARQQSLDAFEHQELPLDRLVDALDLPRDRRFHPLVQVLFVLQNTPAGRFEIPGLRIESLPAAERTSKFDLGLFLQFDAGGLVAEWVYARALFKPDTVQAWAAAWLRGLERAASDPSTPLGAFAADIPKEPPMPTPSPERRQQAKLDKLKQLVSRPATAPASKPLVRTAPLHPGREFPIVLEPAVPDLDTLAWARSQRDFIESTLLRHAGILFRGFGLRTPQDFESFAEALHPHGLFGDYGDLPKKEGGRNTYRSTPYPQRQMILFHNESAHLDRWPRKQWFFCEVPSPVGGATPIVDCREMLRRMPPALVERFERRQLLYVRTFTHKLDVPWREFFKTGDRSEVEARCRDAGIEWRWLPNDELQTRTRCPAVITHPLTGERSFFNQVQLHHVACLEPEVRDDLLALVGPERMPRQVMYGDGGAIEEDVMARLGELYEACAVRFAWQQGDVLMLDNMLAAHARDPYEGPRKVVVAMAEMTDRSQLSVRVPDLARSED